MHTTQIPEHLLPAHHHVVRWVERGEKKAKTFATRAQALEHLRELERKGLAGQRFKA